METPSRSDHNHPWAWPVVVVGALIVMAALGFGRFSYTMLLPPMRQGLGLGYTAAGLLGTANLAGYLVGSLLGGPMSQRIGPRATTTYGLFMLSLALGWMGVVHGIPDAAAARALAGVAGAIVYVQALGLIAAWFPGKTRGLASGIIHCGNGAGLILTGLGLPVVLTAASGLGWRAGWDALALFSLAIVPFGWLYCRSPAGEGSTPVSLPPASIDGVNFPKAARSASLAAYAGLYGLFGLSYIIYATFFAEALRDRGLSFEQTGLAWAVVGTLSLVSGPMWGGVSDRVGRMAGLAVVFGLQAIAYLAFLNRSLWSLALSVWIFGTTAWGIPAIMGAAMSDLGPAKEAPTAIGRVTTVMGAGQAVGPALAGSLADATGIASSGLWVSALVAMSGSLWSSFASRSGKSA